MIEDGVEDEVAAAELVERYAGILEDPDEGPVFWRRIQGRRPPGPPPRAVTLGR